MIQWNSSYKIDCKYWGSVYHCQNMTSECNCISELGKVECYKALWKITNFEKKIQSALILKPSQALWKKKNYILEWNRRY